MNLENSERNLMIKYRVERSKATVEEAKVALDNNQYFGAVNRIYYSVFYMISAIALKDGFSTSKHAQLIGWFNKNYINQGKLDKRFGNILRIIFRNRTKGDYSDFTKFSREQVDKLYSDMKDMIEELEKLIH